MYLFNLLYLFYRICSLSVSISHRCPWPSSQQAALCRCQPASLGTMSIQLQRAPVVTRGQRPCVYRFFLGLAPNNTLRLNGANHPNPSKTSPSNNQKHAFSIYFCMVLYQVQKRSRSISPDTQKHFLSFHPGNLKGSCILGHRTLSFLKVGSMAYSRYAYFIYWTNI